jgi:hypothetical protein
MKSRALAAQAAQVAAQALTAWALFVHLMGGQVDVFTVVFAVAAFLIPLRHDGTSRDRAKTCFGASLVLTSLIGFALITGWLAGRGPTEALVLLTATVLFSVAGGLHWIRHGDEADFSTNPNM